MEVINGFVEGLRKRGFGVEVGVVTIQEWAKCLLCLFMVWLNGGDGKSVEGLF